MRRSLIISLAVHAGLALVLFFGASLSTGPDQIETVEVELVQAEEIAPQASTPEETPKPLDKPEPEPEPEPDPEPVVEEEKPVRTVEAPEPEPVVAPTPEEKPSPPEPAEEARDIPNVTPRTKPKPPSRFDAARIAALLDKRQETGEKAPEEEPEEKQDPDPPKPEPERSAIERQRLTAGIQQAIRQQIERCWSAPAGASYAETLIVRIRIYLLPSGQLARAPEILDQSRMNEDGFFRAAAEAARRAVQKCAPLNLPPDQYDLWRDVVLNFDPSKML